MAVLVEGLTVVMRCEAIVKKFTGGVDAFKASLPNSTLCSDGEIACVNFMVPVDVQSYIEHLTENGLTYKDDGKSIDIVVVDQTRGPTTLCDWVDFGEANWNNDPKCPISLCCAKETKLNQIVVPEGWNYESSLSANHKYVEGESIPDNLKFLRNENGLDVLVDENTGQEFFVRRG